MAAQKIVKHNHWLMKSEPAEFSIDDLKRLKRGRWDGVRSYQVRNMIRDLMKKGDKALFYHSSTDMVGVAGEMLVASDPYPDPTQFDKNEKYFDESARLDTPRWFCVDVKYTRKFKRLVPLTEMRNTKSLSGLRILEKGSRLSIVPVTKREYDTIVSLGGRVVS